MSHQIERRVEDYFIEEVIGDEWTGNLLLVIDARPVRNGKELLTADGSWTWQEAAKFMKICIRHGIPPVSMFDNNGPLAQR